MEHQGKLQRVIDGSYHKELPIAAGHPQESQPKIDNGSEYITDLIAIIRWTVGLPDKYEGFFNMENLESIDNWVCKKYIVVDTYQDKSCVKCKQ